MDYIAKKVRNASNGDTRRRAMRSQYLCSVALHPDDINIQGPEEFINELKKEREELISENRIRNEFEGKKTNFIFKFYLR